MHIGQRRAAHDHGRRPRPRYGSDPRRRSEDIRRDLLRGGRPRQQLCAHSDRLGRRVGLAGPMAVHPFHQPDGHHGLSAPARRVRGVCGDLLAARAALPAGVAAHPQRARPRACHGPVPPPQPAEDRRPQRRPDLRVARRALCRDRAGRRHCPESAGRRVGRNRRHHGDSGPAGSPGDGFAAAIEQCGALLAQHLPAVPGAANPDELPDRLVEI
jgi:hypothetical protein